MQLTEQQQDALTELINIGFGRAASALSMLVEKRVLIAAPTADLYPIHDLENVLNILPGNDIISVHQVFTGRISGSAILLMDTHSSNVLVNMLNSGSAEPEALSQDDEEAMQEIGNILLNAFTGSFGNLLQVHIQFTIPFVRHGTLSEMIQALLLDTNLEFALVVRVNFQVSQGNVSGYVVIILGIQSLESLIQSMRTFGYID